MILIRAKYPFEVDFERGSSSILYPTKGEAVKESRQMVHSMASGGDISLWNAMTDRRDCGDGAFFGKVRVEFERVEIVPLTRAAMCSILNTDGEGSERDSESIGHIDITFKIVPRWDWPNMPGGTDSDDESDDDA